MSEAMIDLLTPVKIQVRKITSDNDKDFVNHKDIKQKLFSPFFFADANKGRMRISMASSQTCLKDVTLDKSVMMGYKLLRTN